MQFAFAVVVLTRESQVDGRGSGSATDAKRIGLPPPDFIAGLVGSEPWSVQVISVKIESAAAGDSSLCIVGEGNAA